jgi:ribosomal protein L11 methyltransferase
MTGKIWQAIEATVATGAREAIEYGLMEAGALGTETIETTNGAARVIGYFDSEAAVAAVAAKLSEALEIYSCAPAMLIDVTAREVPDEDWLTEWKKHWQPIEVGRFVIAPSWSEPSATADLNHIVIRMDPGMAFGTGTHETTRLCLKAIDKYFGGGSFLDVGTGTGILAIAAAKLAAEARIVACDTDTDAIRIAHENAVLNDVASRIDFQIGSVSEEMASADFVCANLTAPVIIDLLPTLLGATCGRLVLSGILDSQFEMVNRRLMQLTASVNEVMQDGEWVALVI